MKQAEKRPCACRYAQNQRRLRQLEIGFMDALVSMQVQSTTNAISDIQWTSLNELDPG